MNQPPDTHLAQLNVASALDDLDSPRLADFVAALDGINALAERSRGFVWRLKDEAGDATGIRMSDNPRFIVNLSVWETPGDLEHFVWNTVHKRIYTKKAKWFEAPERANLVMWWIPVGHRPTARQALARLDDLNTNGPGDGAFGWESLPNVRLWKNRRCA